MFIIFTLLCSVLGFYPIKKSPPGRSLCQKTKYISSALPLLLPDIIPVPQSRRPAKHIPDRFSLSSGPICRINRFPYNGGIPVRATGSAVRPDCSQVITALTMLFPHTIRELSENTSVREVLSCSTHCFLNTSLLYLKNEECQQKITSCQGSW